ncbi:3-phosphoshikimate 1-carboxyvinyltransferase [Portibacter lacus]|uniref:3-phosphoshikimate 1-carboxyvinyltransferase n=2 Tax=Portibacter lacus TaxID=1099794 RepID=A0AA37SNW8_9BACT|nr:3-phosphoshikimate 1-carboxyvinyltransferase [Portibacter lacus]GLR17014.1 3-phosphoshikimate 1-carboxyvinyltransferase [Portibacter lacus]
MKQFKVAKANRSIEGTISLDGSKSLSNRALIIRALCTDDFQINHCATADDVVGMQTLLDSSDDVLDAHHAGTTFRFLCSYLCLQSGKQTLTGSIRMQERPIGPLVDALRKVGAEIEYLKNDGYPPLKIGEINPDDYNHKVEVSAGISSQFISSLLLIAPSLPKGLEITLVGDLVSRPYLEMTLKMMEYFGVKHTWEGQVITVEPQPYKAKDITIEADWSAASYYYIMAAFSDKVDLVLEGLNEESLQGDSSIAEIMEAFGISSEFSGNQVHLKKDGAEKQLVDHDFLLAPDIAQSVAVACAGTGKPGVFSGLKTLKIKETDRIAALQKELGKVGVYFTLMPPKFAKVSKKEFYMVEGKAASPDQMPDFDTYKDHRMAMAFGPLAMLFPIIVNEPDVVSKSYPAYWEDLKKLGFEVEEII